MQFLCRVVPGNQSSIVGLASSLQQRVGIAKGQPSGTLVVGEKEVRVCVLVPQSLRNLNLSALPVAPPSTDISEEVSIYKSILVR